MLRKAGVLAVGNFDSNTGYAWKLMERLWCELSVFFQAKAYQTYVVFPTVSEIPECLTEHNCIVEQEDFTARSLGPVIRQARYLRKRSIKVLYLTDQETSSFRYLVFRLCGVRKIIVHDHTPGVRTPPGSVKRLLKLIINRLPLISCSACFAVSPYVKRRLIEINCVPPSKVYCVTNGIDVTDAKPEARKEDGTVRIVTVGRASYYKGIDFSLKVIRALVFEHGRRDVQYALFGGGPDLEAFKLLAKDLEIEPFVIFHGPVDNVAEKLGTSDIAFHPSKGEAMSLAILEYMRAGLPVVASDNPSVSSALTDGEDGLIYREGSESSATEVLVRLIQSESLRDRIGQSARAKVEGEFSSSAMVKRFIGALDDVI
ncbi:glycosyltransferase [Marinobacter salicampi]|uniref:glycosyltransferase n=1 Tax=Marinobacter salicampi TaxID=435907 RepID=UPI00140E2088|nr:glycosyltransferase [Marinobacter salicampi]